MEQADRVGVTGNGNTVALVQNKARMTQPTDETSIITVTDWCLDAGKGG